MQLQNKNRIAYLTALTLLFSYAEMLLPRIVPFFRLGLGNIVILLSFDLCLPSFLILTVLKAAASSLMGGTLLSPFFLISIAQSVFSGLLMYSLFYLNRRFKEKLLSVYGISVAGSALSALIQVLLCTIYLGKGTLSLLGPMLLFNTISGILTAALSQTLKIQPANNIGGLGGGSFPLATAANASSATLSTGSNAARNARFKKTFVLAALLLIFAAAVLLIKNIYILTAALVLALIMQKLSKRKILLLPHLSLWIFVIISCLFIPEGKILFKIWNFSVTQGALFTGIEKALKLSCVSALSQCAAGLRPDEKTLLGLSLGYYRRLSDFFRNAEGSLFTRIKLTLSAQEL
ncbi:MAG: Gx transporter family protein [Treponema sp.]|nr:Gx transporter family protein [Treponema sp.]